jgi:hypothetical protein
VKNDTEIVRIDLTPNQKEQIRTTIGKDAQAIELTVHELEVRIAPKLVAQ